MKTEFIVLTDAREVAGQRSPGAGNSIFLTEKQAEHPLRLRQIRRPLAEAPVVEPSVEPVVDAEPATEKTRK